MPLAMRLSRFGVGNLRLEQLPPEPLGAGMVRVAFAAVSLNHRDLLVIRGAYGPDLPLPLIPCSDAPVSLSKSVTMPAASRQATVSAPIWFPIGPTDPWSRGCG